MAQKDGTLFVIGNTCYLKYYTIGADGERKRNTVRLCSKSDVYDWSSKKRKGSKNRDWSYSRPVIELQRETMAKIKAAIPDTPSTDMKIVDFWPLYLKHYSEDIVPLTGTTRMRPSTIRGYKQIWDQHLKNHFGNMTLREYTPDHGMNFLNSLAGTQGKNTLKHIRALMSAIFTYAIRERAITGLTVNPIHDVLLPEDAIVSPPTKHYTLEEAEDIVTALVEHVDCQLIMALGCFLGLRPNEILGLKWEDFDGEILSIRRGVVRGVAGPLKTRESMADIPLVDQRVIVPLELWRKSKTRTPSEWVFANDQGKHLHDFGNIISRKIRPAVKKAKLEWKGLYSGRRGACTALVEATGGNYAVAQALLRHKSMKTTLDVYKKAITPEAFKAGMKKLAATNGSDAH
jgi:integrase